MKKLSIFLICFFPLALLFCIFTLRFKPDGSIYFNFFNHTPVVVAGDGSSFQTAYQLRHGQTGSVKTTEIETIRDRYWVRAGRSYEDFYHQCYDSLKFYNTNVNAHIYDAVTFRLPDRTNTVYFDVTDYRETGRH